VRGTRRAAVRDKLENIVDDWRKEEAFRERRGDFSKREKVRLGLHPPTARLEMGETGAIWYLILSYLLFKV